MDFLIADTFTDSLAKLTGDEQKAVKTTAFDLQMNPVNSGMSLHKLDKAKDKNFWSVRVSGDIRLIIHKTAGSLLLCYVDHHDRAYYWAERRRLEAHPKTGAAQLVEIRETVKEIVVPVYVQAELPMPPKPRLFADASDDELLGYGVPTEWLNDVRQSTEDSLLGEASKAVGGHKFGTYFLLTEWEQVVDAWQLETWESYRDVARLGRKTRLPEVQRAVLWSIFERVRGGLKERKLTTHAGLFAALATALAKAKHPPFDFAVVDEAQDISVSGLRFLAAIGGGRPNALFFAGDLGQRIFQQPFSWKSLGVDIRGRSRTLRINYRTSHQIRQQADRLLGPETADVDGNTEDRSDTISVFNGPPPVIRVLANESEEIKDVGAWLAEQSKAGILPHEFGVFVRATGQLGRAQAAVKVSGLPFKILDEHVETTSGHVSISTMHLAKGLEFRAVVVMACDDEIVPLQERIETVGDEADLQEVYDTERHLLYVACTRARDFLLVTSVEPASEFLDDLRPGMVKSANAKN